MNETEEKINKIKKNNLKLYPLYKMFSLDLIFYYAISFIFLSDYKGFSASQIFLADAFYPFFKMLFQIPCTILIEKYGKRNSLIIGNISLCIDILLMIGANSINILILSNLFAAIGFVLKGTIENNILYEAIPKTEAKGKIFSKIESKSSTLFFILEAICSSVTGFMYVINPNIPMILCFIFCIISCIISFKFGSISSITNDLNENDENDDENDEDTPNYIIKAKKAKDYMKEISTAFKYMFQSKRLHSLIYFNAIFASLISLMINLRRDLLLDIGFKAPEFGIIFAILGIVSAFFSSKTNLLHKKLKNKTLTYLSLFYAGSIIIAGLASILAIPEKMMLLLVLIAFGIQYSIKGSYSTLIKKYLNNYSHKSMRIKIHSANTLVECISTTILTLFCSLLLSYSTSEYVTIFIGCIFFIALVFTLDYMKSRVGLKPEEYSNKDINYHELL